MGVKETFDYLKEFNNLHPDILKSIYICKSEAGLEDFLEKSYIEPNKIYINTNKELYTLINPKSARMLNCFGLCYKSAMKRLDYLSSKYIGRLAPPKDVDFNDKELSFDLGGSLVINSLCKVLFLHQMKFTSDHANPESIMKLIKEIYGEKLREKMISEFYENLQTLDINMDSLLISNNNKEIKNEVNLTEIEEENISLKIDNNMNKVHKRNDHKVLTNNFNIFDQKTKVESENHIISENCSSINTLSKRSSTNSNKNI